VPLQTIGCDHAELNAFFCRPRPGSLKAGAAKATLLLTLLSVGASVVLTWLCLAALGVTDVPLQMWLVAAVVAPLTLVPIIFGAIVSLVYQLAAAKAELAIAAS